MLAFCLYWSWFQLRSPNNMDYCWYQCVCGDNSGGHWSHLSMCIKVSLLENLTFSTQFVFLKRYTVDCEIIRIPDGSIFVDCVSIPNPLLYILHEWWNWSCWFCFCSFLFFLGGTNFCFCIFFSFDKLLMV